MPSLIYAPVRQCHQLSYEIQQANIVPLQVFALLVFEMAVFVSLIIPLPFTMKRKLFSFISESPIIAKLQYGLKVSPKHPYKPHATTHSY